MKWIILITLIVAGSGCNLRQREIELDKKMNELNQREQQLDLKEQSLQIKEEQLNERKLLIDSTHKIAKDSLFLQHQQLPGTWFVEMQCIETNCPGSAVGDTKNEQWELKFQDNLIVIKAFSNGRMVRIYSGNFAGNTLRLAVQQDTATTSAKILVRLQQSKEKEMTGEREIIQENGCRILYSLRLKKQ